MTQKQFVLVDGPTRDLRVLRTCAQGIDANVDRADLARASQPHPQTRNIGGINSQLGFHQHQFTEKTG